MARQPRATDFGRAGMSNGLPGTFWFKSNGRQADPARFALYMEDFFDFDEGSWQVTQTGVNSRSISSTDPYGVLTLTNAATAGAEQEIAQQGSAAVLVKGSEAWYDTRWKVNDGLNSQIIFGWIEPGGDPENPVDGIVYFKAASTRQMDAVRFQGGVVANVLENVNQVEDNVNDRYSWYYDGGDKVDFYINDALIGDINLLPSDLPTVEFQTVFFVSGENIETKIDYIMYCLERDYST